MGTEKRCASCAEVKPEEAFHRRRSTRRRADGTPYAYEHVSTICKACEHRARTTYAQTPAGQASARRQWETNLKRRTYAQTESGRATAARYRGTIKAQTRNVRASARLRTDDAVQGDLTAAEWGAILDRYRYTCAYCRIPLLKDAEPNHPQKLTLDHIVPLTMGGRHDQANVVPACFRCNSRKGDVRRIRPLPPPGV